MSIKTFGDYKYEVTGNKEITILKYIGETDEVTIPDSIKDMPVTKISCSLIGDAGFCNSERIKTVMIPEGVREIAMMSFAYSKSLERVYIPASVTEMDGSVFSNSISLTSIIVDEGNKCFADSDGVLFNKEKSQLLFFPIGKSYNMPDGDRINVKRI